MEQTISYEGIDVVELVHALYHGTRALGMGALHDRPTLTVEEVRTFAEDRGWSAQPHLHFDYYAGRPLKVSLDQQSKLILRVNLYDRDAGEGACARIVDALRARAA